MKNFVYCKKDGLKVLKFLRVYGIKCKLIGTLPSNHDIDILITNANGTAWKYNLIKAFGVEQFTCGFKTDIDSYFMRTKEFGHLDFAIDKKTADKINGEISKDYVSCPNCFHEFIPNRLKVKGGKK